MERILSFISPSENKDASLKHDDLNRTPTSKGKKRHTTGNLENNDGLAIEPININDINTSSDVSFLNELEKNLQVLIKVKPYFAEEEEEVERQKKLLNSMKSSQNTASNKNTTILKQQLNELFKDLDPILETPNDKTVCYKGVSMTQQLHLQNTTVSKDTHNNPNLSREGIMSNPIASPNNSRYNRDRFLEYDRVYDNGDGDIDDIFSNFINPYYHNNCVENLNLFTYGSTGCGKTYTIQNILIQLSLEIFFEEGSIVECSYMEIYNDTVRDLLIVNNEIYEDGIPVEPKINLFIREDYQGIQCIDGLSMHRANNYEELRDILTIGHNKRKTEETNLNKRSSRSHSILTLNVLRNDQIMKKKITVVDLAGSERASKAQNKGLRMKEGAMINKSLLALANCINSLTSDDSDNKHVPFRDSKLTRLLKHVLRQDASTKTIMIACVSSILRNKDETLNTLMYAKRCMGINKDNKHLKFNVDSNTSKNDSIGAPTLSTMSRVRSISVRKNDARRLPSKNMNNRVTKNRNMSSTIVNRRQLSQSLNLNKPVVLKEHEIENEVKTIADHSQCTKEVEIWKEKFLTLNNELNLFVTLNNDNLNFLKMEIIQPKVLILLEKRALQIVKNNLNNLIGLFSNDKYVDFRNIILSKITEINKLLYDINKHFGNQHYLMREIEALVLGKGMVIGQIDILSKIIHSEIQQEFMINEEMYLSNYYTSVFSYFGDMEYFMVNSLDQMKVLQFNEYLNNKFNVLNEFLVHLKENKLDEFNINLNIQQNSIIDESVIINDNFNTNKDSISESNDMDKSDMIIDSDMDLIDENDDVAQAINITPDMIPEELLPTNEESKPEGRRFRKILNRVASTIYTPSTEDKEAESEVFKKKRITSLLNDNLEL
ncbi:hypothetical protein FOG51_00567 [Hanseniaspora uvarum]|nr:hypothetical protein FOG51_00567 [Hanseniaspora uvarum]